MIVITGFNRCATFHGIILYIMFTSSQSTFQSYKTAGLEATKCSTFAGTGQSVFQARSQESQLEDKQARIGAQYRQARRAIE